MCGKGRSPDYAVRLRGALFERRICAAPSSSQNDDEGIAFTKLLKDELSCEPSLRMTNPVIERRRLQIEWSPGGAPALAEAVTRVPGHPPASEGNADN